MFCLCPRMTTETALEPGAVQDCRLPSTRTLPSVTPYLRSHKRIRHGTRDDPRMHTSDLQATINFTLRLNCDINKQRYLANSGARNIESARRVIAIREKIRSSFALPHKRTNKNYLSLSDYAKCRECLK